MQQQSARPLALVASAILTLLSGLAFVVVAVAVMATRASVFSIGVGVVLAIYGAMVAYIGWSAWRCRGWAWGAMVAASLLHVAVLLSVAGTSPQPWAFRALAALPLAAATCAVLPASRRAMGR